MEVSVVIPAYQAERSIQRAIQSCHQQTLPPLEIIVVIDGGTDNTEALVREHFPSVNLIVLKENAGAAHARNQGIKQAKGEWIAFLDADDEWHPEKLRLLTQYVREQPRATGFIHPFSTKSFLSIPPASQYPPARSVPFYSLLLQNTSGGGSSICLKTEAGMRFNESFRYCEDHELVLRLAWRKELYYIPYTLAKIERAVLSKGGLSGAPWKMRQGEIKMYGRLGRLHPLLILLIPLLILFSLSKHLWKLIRLH